MGIETKINNCSFCGAEGVVKACSFPKCQIMTCGKCREGKEWKSHTHPEFDMAYVFDFLDERRPLIMEFEIPD